MTHKGYIFQKKEIELTDDEKILHQDFLDAGSSIARYAIWAYVEENEPIPNELKPILLEILQENFKGKSKANTKAFWNIRVKEIILLMKEEGLTCDDAIETVSTKHNLVVETVERRYKQKKYRNLKSALGMQNK